MDKCKDCACYDNEDSYEGTGFCQFVGEYVKENDSCFEFEEKD